MLEESQISICFPSARFSQFYHQYQSFLQFTQQVLVKESLTHNWRFINEFVREKDLEKKDSKGKTVWILEVQVKVACLYEFMMNYNEQKTIASSPQDEYQHVWDKIKIVEAKDKQQTKSDMKIIKKFVAMGTSSTLTQQEYEYPLLQKLTFTLSMSKYMFMSHSAKLYSFPYYRNPDLKLSRAMWNGFEKGACRQLVKVLHEGVSINKKLWIPPDGSFDSDTDIFTEKVNHIQVRLLYNGKMNFYQNRRHNYDASKEDSGFGCFGGTQKIKGIEKILIYFHGGGFVVWSSRTAQAWTRRWCKQLNVPIFCVDYRQPPEHTFPQPVYDCFVAYQFIMHHISQFMNVTPKQIYAGGDSAGGNLACSMTALMLKHSIPPPLGLYLVHPVMDTRATPSESTVLALTEPILWPSFLRLCLTQYFKNDLTQASDPLASPILLTESFVGGTQGDTRFPLKWPKTMMTIGGNDPMLDGVLTAMQRMVQSEINCECTVYKELSHGYIGMWGISEQCQRIVKDSIVHLKELMHIDT